MAISSNALRIVQLGNRFLQWASAVIVLGIVSDFVHKGPRGGHIIYEEVIAAISAAFFLPGLALGFIKKPILGQVIIGIDIVFSYLWLTSFIFTAQDWSQNSSVSGVGPSGDSQLKKATEAFTFLTFIFTFFAILLDFGFIFPRAGPTSTNGLFNDKHERATNGDTHAEATA